MLYLANPCGDATVSAMMAGELGFIDTPRQRNFRPAGVAWCADNGAFSAKWKADHWWSWLTDPKQLDHVDTCLFAVAPDVVGDAVATLERSTPWLARMRGLGYKVAYVAQDGQEDVPLPWDDFDALFVGGTNDFKLGETARHLCAEAKRRGKWVHVGRVNSQKRFRYAAAPFEWGGMGADSADGTYLTFGPDKNLPKLLSWIREDTLT